MTTPAVPVIGRNINFGPCLDDPDRWGQATEDDPHAKELCRFSCPRRFQCAADALKIRPMQGIWSGVLIPTKARERRLAMAQLHNLATYGGYVLPEPLGPASDACAS